MSSTSLRWPVSTTLGTSGASGERFAEVTASGTIWPLLKYCTNAVITSMPTGTMPAMRSVVIGAPPLYGMCVMSIFSSCFAISPTMWPIDPGPPLPKV